MQNITAAEVISLIIQSVLIPLIIYGLRLAGNYLIEKSEGNQVDRAIKQATDAAVKAVQETMQTYVDGIKDTDAWNAEAQKKAFSIAFLRARAIISEEGFKILQTVTGDANAYLTAAIETAVADTKY